MFNIIWISDLNTKLINKKIKLDINEYIDYIYERLGYKFNKYFFKQLLKLDKLTSVKYILETNPFCISSYDFATFNINSNKEITKLITKSNLKINRDYIITYRYKKKCFIKKKEIIYYLHPYAFKICLLNSGLFNIYFVAYERILYNYALYINQL